MPIGRDAVVPRRAEPRILHAVLIFVIGALIAGATGKLGAVVFLLCVGLAGYLLYRRFAFGRTIYDPWP
jgi:hypothetical protein